MQRTAAIPAIIQGNGDCLSLINFGVGDSVGDSAGVGVCVGVGVGVGAGVAEGVKSS